MPVPPKVSIHFFDSQTNRPYASTIRPRKVTIKSSLGSTRRRCWLELYRDDDALTASLGSGLDVWLNQTCCFQGSITEIRLDSREDSRTFVADWNPKLLYPGRIYRYFQQESLLSILDQIISGTGLSRTGIVGNTLILPEIAFSDVSLFAAIDLLAKIAGNWLWDVQEDGTLRFRPSHLKPDHYLYLNPDASTIDLWETVTQQPAAVEILAGLEQGRFPLERVIEMPFRAQPYDSLFTRIYARPIVTTDAFNALCNAILEQMSAPRYERYIDLFDRGEAYRLGDTLRFREENLPFFPNNSTFRVKGREIHISHGNYRVRLHLTSGFESAPTYFYYLRRDRTPRASYLTGRIGIFQLDVSALDTQAQLDSVG